MEKCIIPPHKLWFCPEWLLNVATYFSPAVTWILHLLANFGRWPSTIRTLFLLGFPHYCFSCFHIAVGPTLTHEAVPTELASTDLRTMRRALGIPVRPLLGGNTLLSSPVHHASFEVRRPAPPPPPGGVGGWVRGQPQPPAMGFGTKHQNFWGGMALDGVVFGVPPRRAAGCPAHAPFCAVLLRRPAASLFRRHCVGGLHRRALPQPAPGPQGGLSPMRDAGRAAGCRLLLGEGGGEPNPSGMEAGAFPSLVQGFLC